MYSEITFHKKKCVSVGWFSVGNKKQTNVADTHVNSLATDFYRISICFRAFSQLTRRSGLLHSVHVMIVGFHSNTFMYLNTIDIFFAHAHLHWFIRCELVHERRTYNHQAANIEQLILNIAINNFYPINVYKHINTNTRLYHILYRMDAAISGPKENIIFLFVIISIQMCSFSLYK